MICGIFVCEERARKCNVLKKLTFLLLKIDRRIVSALVEDTSALV